MMKKRIFLIILLSVLVIAIGLAGWLYFQRKQAFSADTTISSNQTKNTAASDGDGLEMTEEFNWDDRDIFKAGLITEAQFILSELPLSTTYQISLTIPEDLVSDISGSQTVRYFNAENQELEQVYFRLFPNFQGGQIRVKNLKVDGQESTIQLESRDTSLRVDLPQPLMPGDSVVLELEFSLDVPTEMGGNYGLFGYFDDVLVLDTFYPMIPAFDEGDGWYSAFPQPNGDHSYNDASFYLVEVAAPADLILASSGVVVDQSQNGVLQQITFAAGPARDFYLAGSREFEEINQQVDDTLVRIYTKPEHKENQRIALEIGVQAIQILNERVGPYPYTEFEVLSSPMLALGIEYPGITSINVNEFDTNYLFSSGVPAAAYLETTLAHEAVHMWFYNIVGNDQQNEPWLDEALAQYLTYIYYLDRYGQEAANSYSREWYGRWNRVEYADIPIGLPAGEYFDQETGGLAYGAIVYGRGPIFYLELEKEYGLEMVINAIRSFYQDHLWGVAQPEDMLLALEDSCQCELDDFYNDWVYGE
jgi:hypothetical protein